MLVYEDFAAQAVSLKQKFANHFGLCNLLLLFNPETQPFWLRFSLCCFGSVCLFIVLRQVYYCSYACLELGQHFKRNEKTLEMKRATCFIKLGYQSKVAIRQTLEIFRESVHFRSMHTTYIVQTIVFVFVFV